VSELAPFILDQAEHRPGQWVLTIHEAETQCVGCVTTCRSFKVTLTEEEYSKLSRTLYHGLRNGTKTTSLLANMENSAQYLWPTGSVDHVAMRHLGVIAVMQYITKETTPYGIWLPSCVRDLTQWRKLPELHRNTPVSEDLRPEGSRCGDPLPRDHRTYFQSIGCPVNPDGSLFVNRPPPRSRWFRPTLRRSPYLDPMGEARTPPRRRLCGVKSCSQ